MNIVECDVLVVGGGVAAVSAVKHAYKKDLNVCLAVKGSFGGVGQRGAGASSCGRTESGRPRLPAISGVETTYDPDLVCHQIVQAGLGVADRRLVSVMIEDAPKARRNLDQWGVVLEGKGPVSLGYPIVKAVEYEIRTSGIQLFEHTMITDLIIHDGQCIGAVGVTKPGEILLFKASAVVLATGGNAQLFQYNVHPVCVTGDGYAMGFRAGASLMNMEFMQIFFCTVYPTRNLFHIWRDMQELRTISNAEGHPFLAEYLPAEISVDECIAENLRHAPFSTRDRASRYLAIAIAKEIQAGRGTEHGGVLLDLTHANIQLPELQENFLRYKGVDVRRAPVQLTMGHQCSNGGLRIDTNAMTTIPGVFAAGEVTTGMHGADRLGGNMLTSCLIFGARAGQSAADWARTHSVNRDIQRVAQDHLDEIHSMSASTGTSSPNELLHTLQKSAWKNALTIRSESRLTTMLSEIRQVREEYQRSLAVENPVDLLHALELRNLLLVGEIVATAASQRQESRGGHYREDFPDCAYHQPVKAISLNQASDRMIEVTEELIDPHWQYEAGDLGQGRWG
jgi:succinate dehydrogenase/fumarate reductase flavoprotein subunit